VAFDTAKLVLTGTAGQDRADVIPTNDGVVLVVADGAGGMGGGAEAAEHVIEAVRRALATFGTLGDPVSVLRAVDRDLAARSSGQTTAVVVTASSSSIIGASVGDSSAWLVGENGFIDLTRDQTRKPLVGSGSAVPVAFRHAEAFRGTLIVASDGLFKYAKQERLCAAAQNPELEAVPASLVDAVRLPSGNLQDDVAVIVCRVNDQDGNG
jgi:serine/threonine protein phosphatase PrpC